MIRRLRIKFIVFSMLIVTCFLALSFLLINHYMKRQTVGDHIAVMQRIAAEPMRPGHFGKDGDATRIPVLILEQSPDGKLISFSNGGFDLSDEPLLQTLFDSARQSGEQTGVLEEYGLRFLRSEVPHGVKFVFSDVSGERDTMKNLLRTSLAVGGAGYVLFFLISLLLSKWAVAPVERAWTQQKQFIADASHELKTPLSVIMANAELLQQADYTDEQKDRFSASILTMSQQMRHLLEQLLDLARLDNVHGSPALVPLDLSALAEDCLLPFEPIFFERGLTLESSVAPGVTVKGDERRLRQTVDILLDNAQKYAEGSPVTVTLKSQGRHALLTVANPAGELSKADREKIFQRFYRGDEARTRTGSYGLGLPIAREIVTRHGGKIGCDWADGEICFTVTLPLSAE